MKACGARACRFVKKAGLFPFLQDFTELLLNKIQKARNRASQWTSLLTPWATAALDSRMRELVAFDPFRSPPEILEIPSLLAKVIEKKTGFSYVCCRARSCSCQSRATFAIPCAHLVFVAKYHKIPMPVLFEACYLSQNWNEFLHSTELSQLNVQLETLNPENDLLPAIYGKTCGRTPKVQHQTHKGVRKSRRRSEQLSEEIQFTSIEHFWARLSINNLNQNPPLPITLLLPLPLPHLQSLPLPPITFQFGRALNALPSV